MNNKFYYLASPYTNYLEGLDYATYDVAQNAALLLERGISVFCPIVQGHTIYGASDNLPLTAEFWLKVYEPFMATASGLVVCMLKGWLESEGITYETKRFIEMEKPIYYMTPGEIPQSLLYCG